jgi:monoamine oxidase
MATAVASVGFGVVDKYLLVWDEPFWDDAQVVAYTPDTPDLFNYFVNLDALRPGTPALVTFAYAAAARALEQVADAEVVALALGHLRDVYGPDVPPPVALRRTRWAQDPNALGSYSFTSTDTEMAHFDRLAEPVGRVHFAGEHTSREYFSTAHGAYLSGLRAAEEVLGA